MQSYLRILFLFFLVSELVFSFSEPYVWHNPFSDTKLSNRFQEVKISSLQKCIFIDFGFFEFVEKEEQTEEKEENDHQSKDQVITTNSDFLKSVLRTDSIFLNKYKNNTSKYLLSQKISLLVLFHSWKFHI